MQSRLLGFHLLWSFAFPSLSLFIRLWEKFPGCLLALRLPLIRAQGIPQCCGRELLQGSSALPSVPELELLTLLSAWHCWNPEQLSKCGDRGGCFTFGQMTTAAFWGFEICFRFRKWTASFDYVAKCVCKCFFWFFDLTHSEVCQIFFISKTPNLLLILYPRISFVKVS